jgi:hypothetical protein
VTRQHWIAIGVGVFAAVAVHFLVKTPGSLGEAVSLPFHTLVGTGQVLNARLFEVSESPESIRAAGQRLLQPFGGVKLLRIYDSGETEPTKKDDMAAPTQIP